MNTTIEPKTHERVSEMAAEISGKIIGIYTGKAKRLLYGNGWIYSIRRVQTIVISFKHFARAS